MFLGGWARESHIPIWFIKGCFIQWNRYTCKLTHYGEFPIADRRKTKSLSQKLLRSLNTAFSYRSSSEIEFTIMIVIPRSVFTTNILILLLCTGSHGFPTFGNVVEGKNLNDTQYMRWSQSFRVTAHFSRNHHWYCHYFMQITNFIFFCFMNSSMRLWNWKLCKS